MNDNPLESNEPLPNDYYGAAYPVPGEMLLSEGQEDSEKNPYLQPLQVNEPEETTKDTALQSSGNPEPDVPSKGGKLVDWDYDNIKEKWGNFKTKFMKILYLEPLDD